MSVCMGYRGVGGGGRRQGAFNEQTAIIINKCTNQVVSDVLFIIRCHRRRFTPYHVRSLAWRFPLESSLPPALRIFHRDRQYFDFPASRGIRIRGSLSTTQSVPGMNLTPTTVGDKGEREEKTHLPPYQTLVR